MRWPGTTLLAILALVVAPQAASAAAGDLDRTFSRDGFAAVADKPLQMFAEDMTLDDKGRALVLATLRNSGGGGGGIGVLRVRSGGALDPTFGKDGFVRLRTRGRGAAIAADSRNRVLLAGARDDHAIVQRLTPRGRVDASFGQRGIAEISSQTSSADDVVVTKTGSVVVSGWLGGNSLVAKLSQSGDLDTGFGDAGLASIDGFALATATVSLRANGELVVAGVAGRSKFGFAALTPEGAPVESFGENGTTLLSRDEGFGGASFADATLDRRGRLVFVGNECTGGRSSRCRAIAGRVLPSGELDRGFGDGGWWSETPAYLTGVSAQKNKLAFSAFVGPMANGSETSNMGVFRLLEDGRRDPSFSGDGKAGIDFRFAEERAQAVAFDDSGNLVLAGDFSRGPSYYNEGLLVSRYQGAAGRPPNADGDRLSDRKDSCEFIFGLDPGGCPHTRRFVRLSLRREGRVRVDVESAVEACTRAVPILLRRSQAGPDEQLERGKTSEYGAWSAEYSGPSKGVYAVALANRVPRTTTCEAAKSIGLAE